jgi:hypothetical protein
MIKQWMTAFLNLIPERFQNLVLGLLAAIIVIICFVIIVTLLKRIKAIHWQDQSQKQTLRLRNNGNLDLRFKLQAFSFQPGLDLSLSYQGQPLPVMAIPLWQPAPPSSQPDGSKTFSAATQAPSSPSRQMPQMAAADATGLKEGAKKGKKKAEKGLAKVKLFSTILGTLGGLLPGEAGAKFKEQSTALQAKAQSAGAAMQAPEQKANALKSLQGQAGQLAGKPIAPKPEEAIQTSAQAAPAYLPEPQVAEKGNSKRKAPQVKPGPVEIFALTSPIAPRAELQVTLTGKPLRRYGKQHYDCGVNVIPWLEEPCPGLTLPKRETATTAIKIKGLSAFFAIFSILLGALVIGANAWWAYAALKWLSQFLQ